MDNFDLFYNGYLASNSENNKDNHSTHNLTYNDCVFNENVETCNQLNKCITYSLQPKYNMIHMSPVDKLIAKNQQKMKTNSNNSSAKKSCSTKNQENINKQNKSIKTSNDNMNEPVKVTPRRGKINWSEKFKERRRSRRLSNLPPINDIKKEIITDDFCESYDDMSYNIISTNIKEEKNIKNEIIDDTYSNDIQQEDSTNLTLNVSSDPNVLSNNYLPQQVEFIEENNEIIKDTMNDTFNFTYCENNFSQTESNIPNNWNLVVNQELMCETKDNKQTNLVVKQELDEETEDNEEINMNLVVKDELVEETVDDEPPNLNSGFEQDNKQTNFYDNPFNNTNSYDTEIQEPDPFSPKILEYWSFKTSERQVYYKSTKKEEDIKDKLIYENTVLEKSLPAINSDLSDEIQETQSPYENNSEMIQNSVIFDKNQKLESSIEHKSVTPKKCSPKRKSVKNKPVSKKNSVKTTNAKPVNLQPTYFEKTNNKPKQFKPILPKPSSLSKINNSESHSKINEPKLQKLDTAKTIEESVLTNNAVEDVPILQRKYSDLSIEEKILYRETLNYVTALGLVSITELENLRKNTKKEGIITSTKNSFVLKIQSSDTDNYTERKYFRTSSDKVRRSYLLEYSNETNNKKHIAVPILIPERSSGSSFHPKRGCMEKCCICHKKFGTLDTPCHIAQLKNVNKQKLCLEIVPHLVGPSSCICKTCFQGIQKKCAKPKLPENVCMFMSCKLPSTKQYNSQWTKKIKCMLVKKGANIRSWANNIDSLPTCDIHHDEILNVTQCQLCGNRTPHKIVLEKSEINDYQTVLTNDNILVTLDYDFFLCKACHAYLLWKSNKMTSSMSKPKNIINHCNTVIKRIYEHHKINTYLCLSKNNIKVTKENILKIPANVISTKHNTKNNIKVTKENISKISANVNATKANKAKKTIKNKTKNSVKNVLQMSSTLTPFKYNSRNRISEKNIRALEENILKLPTNVITKTNTANKIPENIKVQDKTILKMPPKVITTKTNTGNVISENNIKVQKENILRIPAKVVTTKTNTTNKVHEKNIKVTEENCCIIPAKTTSNKPVITNEISENNFNDLQKNIFKTSTNVTSTIPNTANKVPENNINGTEKMFKMPTKVLPNVHKTKNNFHENNINGSKNIIYKIPSKITSTLPNTTIKIPDNNINDAKEIVFNAPSKLTSNKISENNKNYTKNIVHKVPAKVASNTIPEKNIKNKNNVVFKIPASVTSVMTYTSNKIPTINSFRTTNNKNEQLIMVSSIRPMNKNMVDNNNINCQTINFPLGFQPTRPTLSSGVNEIQPLTTKNDKPLPQYNLKQILHPPSTISNNKPQGKIPIFVSVLKPADPTKLLPSFKPHLNLPKQNAVSVVPANVYPYSKSLAMPKVPYPREKLHKKLNISSEVYKIFQELQKPFPNSSELFKHLLLLEKYRLQGDLVQKGENQSSVSFKPKSTTTNLVTSKPMYCFPQFNSKFMSKVDNNSTCGQNQNQLKAKSLRKNDVDDDGRIVKKMKMMDDPMLNDSTKVAKQNVSIPFNPIAITTSASNKFISIPLSIVAKSIICKPDNQIVSSINSTTMPTSEQSKLTMASTTSTTENTTSTQTIRFTSFKNVPMKRVYPLYVNNGVVNSNSNRSFRPILPCPPNLKLFSQSSVKNLSVIRTTKQLTPEELKLARANATANANALLKMGFVPKT